MWEYVGMSRNETRLLHALQELKSLKEEFWQNLKIPGGAEGLNKNLELAGRVADFIELGELMARDALHRRESCGGHFREESQTPEGETRRNDRDFCHVAAWEYAGDNNEPVLHKEPLSFEYAPPSQRSYK
jgi:succinate dehydrogenase / fumarate reductase flavoprotein subunit